jgi:glucose/arabinose dehydrogenase
MMKKNILVAVFAVVAFVGSLKAQYTTTTPITGLSNPVAFTFTPDGRILVTLKAGLIKIFNADGSAIGNFYSLTDSTFNDFERGLLGIEVDPDFATNHYVYAYYNHRFPNNSGGNTQQKLRVVRFTENNNIGTNPTIILNLTPGYSIAGNHVGGNIHMHASEPDKIYVTIGELAVPANAQLLTNPYGKFLRINTDGTIPNDNPFYDDGNPATGNDDRIWSYGHRNAFDFSFSPVNDSLYSTENGQNTWDEMNIVTHSKNYGWNTCEGDYLNGSTTNPCTNPNYTAPLETWAAPLPAITGIVHYNGCLMPEFKEHILIADNDNGYIYNLTMGNAPAYDTVLSRVQAFDVLGLTTLREGPDGYLYALNGGYAPQGRLYKIGPTVLPVADAQFSLSNANFCVGEEVTLTYTGSSSPDLEYTWTTSGSDSFVFSGQGPHSLATSGAGFTTVELIVNNCGQTDTLSQTFYSFDGPTLTMSMEPSSECQGGLAIVTPSGSAPPFTYSWVGFADTDSILAMTAEGYYTVTVTDGNGCSSTDSVFVPCVSGLNELNASLVKVFPNPASSKLYIDLKGTTTQVFTVQVYNATGALVLSQAMNAKSALAEVDVNALPAGFYNLRLVGNNKIYSAKWMKE